VTSPQIIALEKKHLMQTYGRAEVVLERGDGCYVYDKAGKKYLDLFGGIATCSVGHGNADVAEAIYAQAKKLISVSNLYYTEPQVLLAKKLAEVSGLQRSFFCHSGAEANEAAIKLAKKITGKREFISFKNAFHGRTTGSLALTWNSKYKEAFVPLSPVAKFADYGDIDSVRPLIDTNTAAVIVEPIQGEAGIVVPKPGFLSEIRRLCDEHGILMIVDEVQTGVARTGKFFAYQHEGVLPDIVTVAKGLANGLPIGVCLSNYQFEAGEHGSSLGGNNLSCAAALATIKYIELQHLAQNAVRVGDYLRQRLVALDANLIRGVQGEGLMIGIELGRPVARDIVAAALKHGLLCNAPTDRVIRLLPPLTLTMAQADDGIAILADVVQL
jgi:acetylornithine/N-succinyldiaminopimelate aminotransferase